MDKTTLVYNHHHAAAVSPSELLVSSIKVDDNGAHEHVSIWNRGALAGELTLQRGDAAVLAALFGLQHEPMGEEELKKLFYKAFDQATRTTHSQEPEET
jgi:hypothetical protein